MNACDAPLNRRRDVLLQIATTLSVLALPAAARAQAAAHSSLGLVEPRLPPPSLPLTLHDGRSTRLEDLLRGKVTALQLMFTGCSSTCPIQGAVFASVQARLATQPMPGVQLLSISIDPLSDDARQLAAWRQRFNAGPQWLAATPSVQHNDRLPDFLSSRPPPGRAADRHTAQVYLFDRSGRFAYRFADMAGAKAIALGLAELARQG